MRMNREKVTAARLKAVRQRRGWSREELAVRSGLSWSAISQIESGRRTNLRPTTVRALATALGVTADYLLGSDHVSGGLLEHELLLFADDDAFVEGAGPFVRAGVTLGEPTLVVAPGHRLDVLREHLGSDSGNATFRDAESWYSSPPAALERYGRFASDALQAGAAWVRILGEPVWSGTTDAERRPWMRYESLLNLSFAPLPVTVVCTYDVSTLDPQIVAHGRTAHPRMREGDRFQPSGDYEGPDEFLLT